jgi:subtilisin family serine protease
VAAVVAFRTFPRSQRGAPDGGTWSKDAKSKIYGFLPGQSGYSFVTDASGDLPSISDAIAAQFVHRAAKSGESAFAVLETEDFRNTILAFEGYAHVSEKQQLILGASDFGAELRKEYAKALGRVKPLAEKYTDWLAMQWLATQCARGARDWASAVEFSNNLKRLVRIGTDVNLRERVAQVAQEAERELNRTKKPPAHVTIASSAVDWIFEAIGLTKDAADATGVSIGLVGPPPSDASVEVLGGASAEVDSSLRDHQTRVYQVAQVLARKANFVYAPFGITTAVTTNDALIGALNELIKRKPQIILLAWGTSEPNNAIDTLVKQSADKILFVLPAGNNLGQPSAYKNVDGIALVVAAATAEGAPAPFTSTSDDVVWAPGTDIAVVVPALNGTSYSAAVVTGAAAVLLHDFPTATPAQIREALVTTARAAQGRTKPPIINVAAARDWLRTKLGARG